jgi:hypothetical protein
MGDRVCRMGGGPKHRTEASCQAGCVTAYSYFEQHLDFQSLGQMLPQDCQAQREPA